MKVWIGVLVGMVSVGSLACAGGGDSPAGSDTELATDPSSSFSTSSTSTSTSTTDDSSDSQDSDSNSTSTTADSAGSASDGTGTTGCKAGEEGCTCRDGTDPCDDRLDCVEEVCSAGFCDMEDDEPNDDAPGQNIDLGIYADGDAPDDVMSQLDGPDDVDWMTYRCNDTTFEEVDPMLVIDQNVSMRVCFFLDCVNGGNPVLGGSTGFECPGGSTFEMAPFDFLPGCCVGDGSTMDLTAYNCPDSSNDSIFAWMRVDMGDTMTCEPYTLTYNC